MLFQNKYNLFYYGIIVIIIWKSVVSFYIIQNSKLNKYNFNMYKDKYYITIISKYINF